MRKRERGGGKGERESRSDRQITVADNKKERLWIE